MSNCRSNCGEGGGKVSWCRMKPTNLARSTWTLLSGTRLTVIAAGLLIALLAASLAASTNSNPIVAGWLRLSGLADILDSRWFIYGLALLVLNLVAGFLAALPKMRAEAKTQSQPLQQEDGVLRSEFETELEGDKFAEIARRWGRKHLGQSLARPSDASGVLLVAKLGRANALLRWLAHLAFGAAVAGGAWMMAHGFQARTLVEEGSRSGALELLRGPAPSSWKPFENRGKIVAGYFVPGFEIERVPATDVLKGAESLLRFYDEGTLVGSAVVAPGNPVRFRGLTVHLLDYVPASAQNVRLAVTDHASGAERRFASLSKGQKVDLEDFGFQVVDVQPATEINRPAVQLEYQERGRSSERFWVFTEYPDYDFAHRKSSAQHFTLESVTQRTAAEILVGREPGAELLWGGLTLLALLFWVAMTRPEERYWIRWSAGESAGETAASHKVEFMGWSPRPMLFESRFYRLAGTLEQEIENAEASHDRA